MAPRSTLPLLLLALTAGCSVAPSGPEAARAAAEPLEEGTGLGPSFYLVWRSVEGYRASALGADATACLGGSLRAACAFGALDLEGLGLTDDDAQAIESDVAFDPSESVLVFVGSFERRPTLRDSRVVLRVVEIWRAPEAGDVDATDGWYHVSHGAQQALDVNDWTRRSLASLDLSDAPWMSACDPDGSGRLACAPTRDGVLEDAALPAGILVDGWWSEDGALHVQQYMAKVGIGALHAANGYWYCRADQAACDDGTCVATADVCGHQGFHGGGLKSAYVRTPETSMQPWLVGTTQLTSDESRGRSPSGPR